MQIIIQGHGTNVTAAMRDYTQKKIEKLEHHFNNIQKVDVILDARTIGDQKKAQVAEVTLWAAGKKVIHASEAGQDIYAAIDLVSAEIERQVRKHKEKLTNENRRKAKQFKKARRTTNSVNESENQPFIVDVNKFASKPMDTEEAKEEIKLLKKDFLLFRNPESKSINLAYKKGKDILVADTTDGELKNITPEEAIGEIEKTGNNFVLFNNKESKNVSVLYKRQSGNYGLIESKC